ncbi:complement receptor type 2-like [Mercenaria mercenaria]|uniref:complement receptor type 2-like n=1 Tax=Mercenaria mercenaria TaxID=6596 RepID=UPI00234F8121|nr:complement receptor type 2-like [Mercenaria mercenaria]
MEGKLILVLILFRISTASADCDSLPVIENTHNDAGGAGPYASGTVVKFECKLGFNPVGTSKVYKCSGNEWVDGNLKCEQIYCTYVKTPDNGRVVNTPTNEVGTSINFECNEGYDMNGASNMVCRTDGQWSPKSPPKCQIKMCGEFGSIQYATLFQNTIDSVKNGYGSIVEVTCNKNYVLKGSPRVMCQANGYWGDKPTCEQSQCPPYPGLNSSCIKEAEPSGSFFFLVCRVDVPVTKTGPDAAECISGKWDNTEMACYCNCKVEADTNLVSLKNAIDGGYIDHTQTLDWSCKKGSTKVTTSEKDVCNDGNVIKPVCKSKETPVTVTTYKPVTDESGSTVNPPPGTTGKSLPQESTPVGAIIGGILGGIAVVILAIVGFICYKKKKRNPEAGNTIEKKAMFTNGSEKHTENDKEKVKLADSTEGEAV